MHLLRQVGGFADHNPLGWQVKAEEPESLYPVLQV